MSRANPRYHRYNPPLPVSSLALYEATLLGRDDGQDEFNTFCYALTPSGSSSAAQIAADLAGTIYSSWGTPWGAAHSDRYTCDSIRITNLSDRTVPSFVIANPGTNMQGSIIAPSLPITVAAVLKRTTAIAGQHGRGRLYIGSVPTTFTAPLTDANIINTTGFTAYEALLPNITAPLSGARGSYQPVIVQHPLRGPLTGPPPNATQAANIIGAEINPRLGNRRRRNLGVGK